MFMGRCFISWRFIADCILYLTRNYPYRHQSLSCPNDSLVWNIWCGKGTCQSAMALCVQQFLFWFCCVVQHGVFGWFVAALHNWFSYCTILYLGTAPFKKLFFAFLPFRRFMLYWNPILCTCKFNRLCFACFGLRHYVFCAVFNYPLGGGFRISYAGYHWILLVKRISGLYCHLKTCLCYWCFIRLYALFVKNGQKKSLLTYFLASSRYCLILSAM